MGGAVSVDEIATSTVRIKDLGRTVDFDQYLEHISGKDPSSPSILTSFPADLLQPKYMLVQRLSLSFHGLRSLPDELAYRMPHLAYINACHNRLQNLPRNFGHLFHLKEVLLSNNRLSSLPDSFSELQQLHKLDLAHNNLSSFPVVLLHLRRLELLNVSYNVISELPLELANMSRLTSILCFMNRCQIPPQEVCQSGTNAILEFLTKAQADRAEREQERVRLGLSTNAVSEHPASSSCQRNTFPRVRGAVSSAVLDARLTPIGQPTAKQLQRTPLKPPDGATQLEPSELCDRVAGLIYGAALGDAVGLATEFMSSEECRFHYGTNGEQLSLHEIVRDRHRCKWQPGDWTDDTDQMLLILSSLIEWAGVVDEVDFAKRLTEWCNHGFPELGDRNGWGVGATVGQVVSSQGFTTNPHETAQRLWQGSDRAANGAVMRTSILGVPHFHDLDEVTANALRICKATHYDPRCQASCVSVCCAIALLLQGKHDISNASSLEEVLATATQCGRQLITDEKHLSDFDHYTSVSDFQGVKCDETGKIGYTLKPLGAAWAGLRRSASSDFRSIITQLVMCGGDSDSNATVCGALFGCLFGYSRLPKLWMNSLLSPQVTWLNAKINILLDLMALP